MNKKFGSENGFIAFLLLFLELVGDMKLFYCVIVSELLPFLRLVPEKCYYAKYILKFPEAQKIKHNNRILAFLISEIFHISSYTFRLSEINFPTHANKSFQVPATSKAFCDNTRIFIRKLFRAYIVEGCLSPSINMSLIVYVYLKHSKQD